MSRAASNPTARDGGAGGESPRSGGRDWGGRIGARLEELDRSARQALREVTRVARPGGGVAEAIRSHPYVALTVAVTIGLLLGISERSPRG